MSRYQSRPQPQGCCREEEEGGAERLENAWLLVPGGVTGHHEGNESGCVKAPLGVLHRRVSGFPVHLIFSQQVPGSSILTWAQLFFHHPLWIADPEVSVGEEARDSRPQACSLIRGQAPGPCAGRWAPWPRGAGPPSGAPSRDPGARRLVPTLLSAPRQPWLRPLAPASGFGCLGPV